MHPTMSDSPPPADVQIGQMPSTELLGLTPLFITILSQLGSMSGPAGPQRATTKLIPVAAGLPALPKKLVEHWLNKSKQDSVDFCELPPAKGRTRPLPSQEERHVIVVQHLSGTCKMIPDLATWLQCFALYMAVITNKEPDRTNNLLAYMVTRVY